MSGTRTRTVQFEDPEDLAAAARGKSGLELLRQLCAGRAPAAPIQATLGFDLLEVQDGFARYQAEPGEHWFGVTGVAHGGSIASLLDAAMGSAVLTTLGPTVTCAVAGLNVHFTRALTLRTGPLVCEGWVVHRGSRLVTAEARLSDGQQRLLAHGSGTYSVVER